MLLLQVLSLLVLAVSTGVVSTEERYSLAGLGLLVSLPVFLWFSEILLAILILVYILSLENLRALEIEIQRLYRSIGYEPTIDEERPQSFSPTDAHSLLIGYDDLSETKLGKLFGLAMVILVGGITAVLLPMAAQIAGIVKLAQVVGWQSYWIWTPPILFILISTGAFVVFLSNRKAWS